MLKEKSQIRGRLSLRLFGSDGRLKLLRITRNMVVTAGLNHIADQLASSPAEAAMSHMAVGDDGTAPSAGQTALIGSELGRVALDSRTASSEVVTYVATFGAGTGTGAIVEAGIFNSDTAGTLLCRSTFSVINKGASDTLEITWTLTFADA